MLSTEIQAYFSTSEVSPRGIVPIYLPSDTSHDASVVVGSLQMSPWQATQHHLS